jgi:hypothetical protein
MAVGFTIKKGDTHTPFTDTLTDINGSIVNLTTATSVQFVMRAQTSALPKVQATGTITGAASGAVSYTFTAQDTNIAGRFDAEWLVTWNDGTVQRYPQRGYRSVSIEEDLSTTGGSRLVSLEEIRDHLRMDPNDVTFDARLLRLLDACTVAIENVTGPILQRVYQEETYDGGQWFISLRHRPIVDVLSVVEYRGPVPYVLTQVPTPDLGTIYSYTFEPAGRIVRRTVGGGVTPFPPGANQVFVTYTAGQLTVPANVKEAALRLIDIHFQRSDLGGSGLFSNGTASVVDDQLPTSAPIGFFMPNVVRELLMPNRRHPSVA